MNESAYPSTAFETGIDLEESGTTALFSRYPPSVAKAAKKLGVENPKELDSAIITVDRQNLLQMINTESIVDGMNAAEYFFHSVMTATTTSIIWPHDLQMDATSSKDPQVRILGVISEVTSAKEHILARLGTLEPHVIMQMDVSHVDHANIIGPGGQNIKRIMENTASYVHFSGTNRSNLNDKSNHVKLYGSLEGVEHARSLIRLSATLVFAINLPFVPGSSQPDINTPYIDMIMKKFKVRIFFSTSFNSALILVKGYENEAAQVQAATQMLINFSCGKMASYTLVQMRLEISPLHHEIVKGNNNTNVLNIMKRTNTKIIFPDLQDMNMNLHKRSQVTIRGTIDGVYKARQQLLGNLPIALIFDLPANRIDDVSEIMMALNNKYDVIISLSHKLKYGTLPVITIKGVEKSVSKIFEARHEILRLSTVIVKPDIPESYNSLENQELSLIHTAALYSRVARVCSESTQKLSPTATDDGYLTDYSAASTYTNESVNSDRGGRRSSDGVGRFSFGASRDIDLMQQGCVADTYHNFHFDVENDRTFDFDMRRASCDFNALKPTSTINDELQTPTTNWMVLDSMIRQCGDTSMNSSTLFNGSAAPGAGRRVSSQW